MNNIIINDVLEGLIVESILLVGGVMLIRDSHGCFRL